MVATTSFLSSFGLALDRKSLTCEDFALIFKEGEFRDVGRGRGWRSVWWLVFRGTMFLYITAVALWSFTLFDLDDAADIWLTYLTCWSIVFETLYLGLALLLASIYATRTIRIEDDVGWSIRVMAKIVWFLRNALAPASFMVMFVFWIFLTSETQEDATTAQLHGMNWVVMMLDLLFGAMPFRLTHGWCLYTYLMAYAIFTVVYFVSGVSSAIYSQLDWTQPVSAIEILVLTGVTIAPLSLALSYGFAVVGKQLDIKPDENVSDSALDEVKPLTGSDHE